MADIENALNKSQEDPFRGLKVVEEDSARVLRQLNESFKDVFLQEDILTVK
jgi:hypothetical protein